MKVFLWGGRSKARIIIEMISEIYAEETEIIGVFDRTLKQMPFDTKIKLYSEKTDIEMLCNQATHFIVCIGGEYGFARFKTAEKLKERGLLPLDLISPNGLLDKLESYGEGLQVMPGAIAHKFSRIGKQCILNTNSTVDHECLIGDGVHIMGGATIAGKVEIGDFSTIGTNATILPKIVIGKNVYVGAGAVVTKNIVDNVVIAGVPAKTLYSYKPDNDLSMFE
jgi:sugar O-acyltransferase (sialic acid O-acetyltransferase NeuD family)